jgi:di/tricarboxylate transporter
MQMQAGNACMCCCCPVGNLMVFTAGNYKTMDFVRLGVFLQVGIIMMFTV